MKRLFYGLTLLTIFSSIWLSCRKDIHLDDSDKNFPINLTATLNGDSIVLNWDNKRVTQFKRIIVLRSNAPMPTGMSPLNPVGAQTLLNSNDATINRFAEVLPFFSSTAYYKVFYQIDERFIESDNVSLQFSTFADDGRPESVHVHPDSNWVVLTLFFNNISPQIVLVDLNKNKIIGRATLADFFDLQYSSATFMRYQNKEYLLVVTNSQRYLRYELPQMTLVEEKTVPYQTWSILGQRDNDLIFMTHYDYYKAVTVRKTGNILNPIESFERPNNYYYNRKQYFLNASQNQIIEVSPYDAQRFRVTAAGVLDPLYSKSVGLTGYSPYSSQMPIAPGGAYFIPNLSGAIYNENLELVNMVPLDPQRSLVDYCFSPDGNHVYVVDQGLFPVFSARIRKFTLPGLVFVGEVQFNNVQAKRLVATSHNELIFWFTNGNEPVRFSYKTIQL